MSETASIGSRLVATGHYQPERVLTNDEMATIVETSDEWIRLRTGIATRRIARDDETVVDLAEAAGRDALASGDITADEIDLVIVASCTSDQRSPNTAGRVAQRLGLNGPAIIDVNVACSGYVHALAVADQAIRAGSATTALVIGAEKLSAYTDWTDRTTCVLVADAAGAMILQRTDRPTVSDVTWGSVPELTDAVRIEPPTEKFAQEGKSVFKWGISAAEGLARESVRRAGYELSEIGVFVSHQANLRIIEPLARQLGLTDVIVATDITASGNTSAASIPLAFSKLYRADELPADTPTLLFGFGGGFAYAGLVIRTPEK